MVLCFFHPRAFLFLKAIYYWEKSVVRRFYMNTLLRKRRVPDPTTSAMLKDLTNITDEDLEKL